MELSNKGKSVTTSTPSMAIRFNATAEEIEEIYTNEEEGSDHISNSVFALEKSSDLETSPRRSILPLLGKRSTSIDTNSVNTQDSSPPSDPWRFLSDIKGKITKRVEVKITEYKSRGQEGDNSPKIMKPIKDSKENSSSLSDSEEASESSISRTCGIVSTTEGVEMSSDDESASLSDEDKRNNENIQLHKTSSTSIRQRYKITNQKKTTTKEGLVSVGFLDNIQKISDGVANTENQEIESGVDVLAEDLNISNFEVDSKNILNIREVTGLDIRNAEITGDSESVTVFSPTGFVDLRNEELNAINWKDLIYRFRTVIFTCSCLLLYFYFPISLYASGFIAGGLTVSVMWSLYVKCYLDEIPLKATLNNQHIPILGIPAIKEYQPFIRYEGWVNEYPEEYNPLTYHVSQTQSVYFRLQGNFLKVSHTRQKIPKRAMWNEPEHKLVFTRHRIYNLLGAKILLLPEGLAKIRHWSKKYPICIVLDKDHIDYYKDTVKKDDKIERSSKESKLTEKKGESVSETQVFSKLVENAEEQSIGNISVDDSVSIEEALEQENFDDITDIKVELEDEEEDSFTNFQDWLPTTSSVQESPDETRIYIFGRTGREKEDWFRRLRFAANRCADIDRLTLQDEYLTYMKGHNIRCSAAESSSEEFLFDDQENSWVNALIARVLFDCVREQTTTQRIKERIQRKLASVRLPYFIQDLTCQELNLGTTSPAIIGSNKPTLNDRGLWIDLDISYEGLAVVILQTKVNLLKLKQPHDVDKLDDKSAIFNSDVDDSAESTTDEEPMRPVHTILDAKGIPVPGLGGTSNRSKKLMKMVDRIAESKFFQAATENKFIKKAMEEFSNTDLRLKVEIKKCTGKLVLNIPPPPTDRVWLGFRVPPELLVSAYPIVGERNISFMRVTSWIEKKIYKEFQKIFVIPNMEDILIPVMCPKLPV